MQGVQLETRLGYKKGIFIIVRIPFLVKMRSHKTAFPLNLIYKYTFMLPGLLNQAQPMSISQWESMTEGNRGAFLSIYESHYQALFSYGFTLTASRDQTKDFIQELFLEIWNKHASVNKDVINVRAYLFTWLRRMIFKENKTDFSKSTPP